MSRGSGSTLRIRRVRRDGASSTTTGLDPTAQACWPHRTVVGCLCRLARLRGPRSGQPVAKVGWIPLRVVLAPDNYLAREGISALLAEGEGIEVVDTATDLDSLMRS